MKSRIQISRMISIEGADGLPQWETIPSTWGNDPQVEELGDGVFAVTEWRTDGLTAVGHTKVLGLSAEELNAPTPVEGWDDRWGGMGYIPSPRVLTLGDLLAATAARSFMRAPKGPRAVIAVPFECGCQHAAKWAIVEDGHVLDEVEGVGDCTPIPDEAASLKEGRLITSSAREDEENEWKEAEASARRLKGAVVPHGTRIISTLRRKGVPEHLLEKTLAYLKD